MENRVDSVYPTVARWVKAYGWIEIGQDYNNNIYARALDEGGMVWEGSNYYETLEEAMQDLESGISGWLAHIT